MEVLSQRLNPDERTITSWNDLRVRYELGLVIHYFSLVIHYSSLFGITERM